jgi:hypothetical protein
MTKLKVLFLCLLLINLLKISADEEKYNTIFQNYLGFYIYVNNLNDVIILKLSLNGYLELQRYYIENNELLEGDIIVLDKLFKEGNGRVSFFQNDRGLSNNDCELFYYTHILFVPINNMTKNKIFIYYETEINNSYIFMDVDNSLFTKNIDDVINLINSNIFTNIQN